MEFMSRIINISIIIDIKYKKFVNIFKEYLQNEREYSFIKYQSK